MNVLKKLKYIVAIIVLMFLYNMLETEKVFAIEDMDYPFLKVGIFYGSTSPKSWDVYFEDGIKFGVVENNDFIEINTFFDVKKIHVTFENGDVYVTGTNENDELIDITAIDEKINAIVPIGFPETGHFVIKERPYRGGLIFNGLQNSLNMINFVPLEYYLYGVLNGELGSHNPMEALKAQAVAARSFAFAKKNQHRQFGFDLCNKSHCQLYKGMRDEKEETTEAVNATKHQVLWSDGKVAAGYFFKNSGGYTQNVEDVWGSKHTYLRAKKDSYSPDYFWKKTYSFDEIENRLRKYDIDVGNLQSVSISKRLDSGAVEEITVIGTDGVEKISNQKIRKVFGYHNVKSMMFAFSALEKKEQEQPLIEEKELTQNEKKDSFIMISSQEKRVIEDFSGVFIISKNLNQKLDSHRRDCYIQGKEDVKKVPVEKLDRNQDIAERNQDDFSEKEWNENQVNPFFNQYINTVDYQMGSVTFYGKGYGHGIGLPQDSIVIMAREGKDYEEILHYYYTNIEINNISDDY